MLARLIAYARGLARRRAIGAEVDDELRFHVEQEIEAQVARGVPAAEARRRVLRDLGGLTQTREAVRDVRTIWLDDLRQDMRYAIRTLRRSPGFASVAILTLTLGIGANTAIFSIVNAVLLRPLPYRDSGALALLEPLPMILTPAWMLPAWRERARSVTDFAGTNGPRAGTLLVGGEPEPIDSAEVTWNLCSFLGVPPAIGREFTQADASAGASAVAMLSHDFWMRRFGGTRRILGTTIVLGGEPLTIVGVTSPAFRFPAAGALPASGLPIDTQPDVIRVAKSSTPLNAIARLAPGATTAAAGAELLAIYRQEAGRRLSPRLIDRAALDVVPLQRRLVGDVRQRLWLVMGAVGFVLLVACANVANLLLARASTRQRELALRAALGAGRRRLARMLVSESLLLALIGAAGALLATWWMRGIVQTMLATSIPHVGVIAIDWWVLAFNAAVAAVTGIVCGLASLPGASSVNPASLFNAGGTPALSGPTRIRRVLLSTEIAVTFVLVVGAALLVQTLWNLHRTARGFDPDRLLTVRVSARLPADLDRRKPNAGQTYFAAFFDDVTQRIRRVPGVTSAAAVSSVPLAGVSLGLSTLAIDGRAVTPADSELTAQKGSAAAGGSPAAFVSSITPDYFRTMGTRLVAGRDFDDGDRMGGVSVAIVNDAFRRRFAQGRDLIGSRVTYDTQALTVVGVVEDVPDRSLRDAAQPLLFMPLAQMASGPFGWGQLTLVVRTQAQDPRVLGVVVRREIWAIDPALVVDELSSMEERVAASVRSERQSAVLFGLFALAALLIAAIGVYGVATYAMAQRTKEIGIRAALGAGRREFVMLVVSQTMGPTMVGVAAGLAGAWVATRLLGARLHGVTPLDPASFAGAAVVLVGVAFAASYLPARRVMKVDPLVALRSE